MAQRIVITGAGGMLGQVLADQGRLEGRDVRALTSADCDIANADTIWQFVDPGDVVINCAAYTQVDAAETDQVKANAVNAVGPGHIATVCAQAGAGLVHISTDYVFGAAREHRTPYEVDDVTGPVNVYGQTKLAGEHAVLAAKPDAYVVRTAWVYRGDGNDFVATMRRLAAGDGPVDVVADQTGSPTYTGDLVSALLQIADGGVRPGVLHAVNAGTASRFDLARETFAAVGADPERIRPVGTDRYPRAASRPAYTVLSARRSVEAGLRPLRDWREALFAAVGKEAVG